MKSSYDTQITGTYLVPYKRACIYGYVPLSILSTMAVSDLQLVVNTLLYFSIFVCGFVISIPLGVANVSKEKVLFTLKTRYVYAR